MMKKVEEKVINFIAKQELLSIHDKVLISLSGGPDSVFLLLFFLKFKSKYGIQIGIFHLNHQLRGDDSDEDEKFCKKLAEKYSLPFYGFRKPIKSFAKKMKVSLEEAGRICRYDELNKISQEHGYSKIATAHNSDDNTETVLLNLVKGAGLRGISGIPLKRGNIIRPLLVVSKSEILEYLKKTEMPFRIDSSNYSVEFQRNLLRAKVLPILREINPSLDSTILSASRIFDNLDKYLSKMVPEINSNAEGNLIIPLEVINLLDKGLKGYFLKNNLERNFSFSITFNDIDSIIDLLTKESGKSVIISSGIHCYKERDHLFFSRNISKKELSIVFRPGESACFNDQILMTEFINNPEFSTDNSKEYISGDLISGNFEIRNWTPGDRFYPLGMKGSKKVSDYLNELKIESHKKNDQLVLVNNNKIVWIIGSRLDNRFKLKKTTNIKIQLWLKKKY